jgi:hypothetical protein
MSENSSHIVHNDCLWYLLSVVPIVTSGSFRIVRKLSDVNYQVNVGARRGLVTYHINLLKRYNRNRVMNIFVEHESVSDTKNGAF